jgi:membrane fusion protein, multidrug efflux system
MRYFSFCVIALSLLLASCDHHHNEAHESSIFTVTRPIVQDTVVYREYVCQIRSIQHIELRAIEKGYLQQILVDEGQTVREGQLLFRIMPVIYQAEAQKSQAEVQFAEIEYMNTKALADSNIVSKNELALAKARLDMAKSELRLAETHLGFTEIKAPFNGIVGRFNDVRLGSLVDEGDLLTTLSDNNKIWVYFNVPEAEYLDYAMRAKVDTLEHVHLQLANSRIYNQEGIVETIEADFNNETGNIAFRAAFDNPDIVLRNGETGNILMPVPLNRALLIPQEATFEILDKKFVFVVENDTVRSREIKVGAELPHLYEIKEGLKPEDQILVEGLRKVKNGDAIKSNFKEMREILNELNHLHAE